MISLKAVLAECGILSELEQSFDNLNIPDAKTKEVQREIALVICNALVESGFIVIEDYDNG